MQDPSRASLYLGAMTNLEVDSAPESADRRPASVRAPALSDYGLIGDMRTAALVGLDGAIDWSSTQRYLPRTNILETTFRTASGVAVVTDFMPVDEDGRPSSPHPEIHRQLRCPRGR